jgi:hypothetical protein
MAQVNMPLPQVRALGQTMRKDRWWVQPLLVFLGFAAFIIYSTWAALQGDHYFVHGTHYLSPMYSPTIFDSWKLGQGEAYVPSGHAWLGQWPEWMPRTLMFLPLTPAFLILWAPGGFRFTCYYYRGAYYKAFWADPLSCSVGEPKFRGKKYRGEYLFPLILQNVHRYFLYLAILFIFLLSYDALISYWFTNPDTGRGEFGIGIGTLVLTINPILLGLYTFGCHSFRHLIGGVRDRLSGRPVQKKAYDCVTCLNRRHMLFAWLSLFWVGFTDFYVRMVSMGVLGDFRIV